MVTAEYNSSQMRSNLLKKSMTMYQAACEHKKKHRATEILMQNRK